MQRIPAVHRRHTTRRCSWIRTPRFAHAALATPLLPPQNQPLKALPVCRRLPEHILLALQPSCSTLVRRSITNCCTDLTPLTHPSPGFTLQVIVQGFTGKNGTFHSEQASSTAQHSTAQHSTVQCSSEARGLVRTVAQQQRAAIVCRAMFARSACSC